MTREALCFKPCGASLSKVKTRRKCFPLFQGGKTVSVSSSLEMIWKRFPFMFICKSSKKSSVSAEGTRLCVLILWEKQVSLCVQFFQCFFHNINAPFFFCLLR